jgi:glutamate 5-kinase
MWMQARRKPCAAARASCRPASPREGRFERGDAVVSATRTGSDCARVGGYSNEARLIRGRRSQELEGLLGYRGRDEIIHRDDLVLT